jgi:hypothetical protein
MNHQKYILQNKKASRTKRGVSPHSFSRRASASTSRVGFLTFGCVSVFALREFLRYRLQWRDRGRFSRPSLKTKIASISVPTLEGAMRAPRATSSQLSCHRECKRPAFGCQSNGVSFAFLRTLRRFANEYQITIRILNVKFRHAIFAIE